MWICLLVEYTAIISKLRRTQYISMASFHGQLLPCYLRDLIMLKSVITPPYPRLGRSHLMTHLAKRVTVWSSWLLFMVMNQNEGNMSALVTDSLPGARQSI